VTVSAEVASWWKGNAKSDYSSLPSMMFEDNVGEDGLSTQSLYTIDINDSNYCLVWAKKVSLAAICLVAGSASFGLREN
jgi:hypothetical protein